MAKENGFRHIKFTRLFDVLGLGVSDCMTKGEYIAVADLCRKTMEEVFLPPGFDLNQRIREDRDTRATYLRYLKAAGEDLRWGPNTPAEVVLDPARYAVETERAAKGMMRRMLVSLLFLGLPWNLFSSVYGMNSILSWNKKNKKLTCVFRRTRLP